jgi:hypothetical protein
MRFGQCASGPSKKGERRIPDARNKPYRDAKDHQGDSVGDFAQPPDDLEGHGQSDQSDKDTHIYFPYQFRLFRDFSRKREVVDAVVLIDFFEAKQWVDFDAIG